MSRHPAIAFAAALVAAGVASCSSGPDPERLAHVIQAVENGVIDPTHTFVVGVVQASNQRELQYCSGVLLGPNLVATARHCVAVSPTGTVDCATSTFGAPYDPAVIYVTADTQIDPAGSNFAAVSTILVPSGPGLDAVCGHDIALLVLASAIALPQYVVPVTDPPMTDAARYTTRVTAIGYGEDAPADVDGSTAGVRRIKEDIDLACIPGDTSFVDCASNPAIAPLLSASEFLSGDGSTCSGDSGSGAFEQSSFDRGQWVSFGVLSRGAVDADGSTCIAPIYSRFDVWASWLAAGAMQAAAAGGYAAPAWALALDGGAADATTPLDGADDAAVTDSGDTMGDASNGVSPSDATDAQDGAECDGASCRRSDAGSSVGAPGGCSASGRPAEARARGVVGGLLVLAMAALRGARRRRVRRLAGLHRLDVLVGESLWLETAWTIDDTVWDERRSPIAPRTDGRSPMLGLPAMASDAARDEGVSGGGAMPRALETSHDASGHRGQSPDRGDLGVVNTERDDPGTPGLFSGGRGSARCG